MDEPRASDLPSRIRLGPGEEFRRIRAFLGDALPGTGVRIGPGDDAAVLADGTVLSTDLFLEDVHFRSAWLDPAGIGTRAVGAALSDLAAMAAEPSGFLVSLALPEKGSAAFGEALMRGAREAGARFGAPLLGGDLTVSPGPVVVDVAVVGRTGEPLLRSGARPGDELWVTGTLGRAAAAVALWESGRRPPRTLRRAFEHPTPRIREAIHLSTRWGATAGLDLSDGVAGDAGHMAAASGVRIVLESWAFPVDPEASLALDAGGNGAGEALALALHGGDDFELLVALPPGLSGSKVEEFRERFHLSFTRIGRVEVGEGVYVQSSPDSRPTPVERGGWDHFGRGGTGGAR